MHPQPQTQTPSLEFDPPAESSGGGVQGLRMGGCKSCRNFQIRPTPVSTRRAGRRSQEYSCGTMLRANQRGVKWCSDMEWSEAE